MIATNMETIMSKRSKKKAKDIISVKYYAYNKKTYYINK